MCVCVLYIYMCKKKVENIETFTVKDFHKDHPGLYRDKAVYPRTNFRKDSPSVIL